MLLEICCYSLECGLEAEQSGADRIELCSAPKEGGLTPSFGVLKQVRSQVKIPVHPIIRPRGGDFCYSESEFISMLEDIQLVKDLGFPGLVIGMLKPDGHIDIPRMRQVMAICEDMSVTFHRAFDMCCDPIQASRELGELGVARILTSGQCASAEQGISLIKELNRQFKTPIIMAGAGVRLSNVQLFIDQGIEEIHSSASCYQQSPMVYRNQRVSMSADAEADEFNRYRVDGTTVAAMKRAIAL